VTHPTMRDVAVRAGVGLGTVSRVVNGGALVRADTAERVRVAITELGYQRNEIARALRPGMHSATLALLVGDLTNTFYASIAKAAVEVARERGYAMVVSTVDEDPRAEQDTVRELIGRRVAGLLVVPDQGNHEFLRDGSRPRPPVVFVDRPATGIQADVVMIDNDRGGWLATRHLIERGHRRIAILVAPSYYTTGQRLRGYRRALRASEIPADDELIVRLPDGSSLAAAEATTALLAAQRRPTAIFATTNFLAEGALRALHRTKARLAVVAFDDFRLADLLPTPATVVSSEVADLGSISTRLLIDRINGGDGPPQRIVLPVRIIERGSGELPP